MKPPAPLSQQKTIELLLDRSARHSSEVPIRRSFLEVRGAGGGTSPGPMSKIISRRDDRALELFLLTHAVASSDKITGRFDITEWSQTWARTLGLFDPASGMSAVSRVWKRLVDDRLISRKRGVGRKSEITILREDGSGSDYSLPGGGTGDPYFKLSFDYWRAGWHQRLKLAGKAVLLICLSREPRFYLPFKQAGDWYGLHQDTIRNGVEELIRHDLLEVVETRYIPSLASPNGWTERRYYELRGPFAKVRAEAEADGAGPSVMGPIQFGSPSVMGPIQFGGEATAS